MKDMQVDREIIKNAWEGRVSGCILGKPVEVLSILKGRGELRSYLEKYNSWPLRDYVPLGKEPLVEIVGAGSCKEHIKRSEPDDDINYTVLALMMLEEYGIDLKTTNIAVSWLKYLPAGATFTAERAAYRTLLDLVPDPVVFVGLPDDFDLNKCAENEWSDWIGAQIRADMYGWVCPGRPELAAKLARQDASLSHQGEGIYGAVFIAALGAAIPASSSLEEAISRALKEIPKDSEAAAAIEFARSVAGKKDAVDLIHKKYKNLPAVHTINNLALVVWALLSNLDDFSAAIGDVVAAGWDTDCNGATVGGLWGLTGKPIPKKWTAPWQGKIAVTLAGVSELHD